MMYQYRIYEAKNRKEAEDRFRHWKSALPKEIIPFYQPFLRELDNWEEEFITYFDFNLTDSFTKSINDITRITENSGRGYSLESLKKKVHYTYGFLRKKQQGVTENSDSDTQIRDTEEDGIDEQEAEYINYGVPVPAFLKAYERGDF